MDFRKHPRMDVQLRIAFRGDQIVGEGTVCNLCSVGCGVRSSIAPPIGAFLEVQIYHPSGESLAKVEVAVVRWCIGQQFGLDFLQITPEEQERLRHLAKGH